MQADSTSGIPDGRIKSATPTPPPPRILPDMKLRLAEIRNRHGWSQQDLADRANVSLHTIQKYEQDKGGMSSLDKIAQLADALEVHPLSLLSEDFERMSAVALDTSPAMPDEHLLARAIEVALDAAHRNELPLSPSDLATVAMAFYRAAISKARASA